MIPQHFCRERWRQQRAIPRDEPALLGKAPMGGHQIGPRQAIAIEEHAIIATAIPDGAIANLTRAKPAMLLPNMLERHTEPLLPLFDQRRRRRPRTVIGDHHLEAPVGLTRQRPQHGVKRIRTIERRHQNGDQVRHGHLPQ